MLSSRTLCAVALALSASAQLVESAVNHNTTHVLEMSSSLSDQPRLPHVHHSSESDEGDVGCTKTRHHFWDDITFMPPETTTTTVTASSIVWKTSTLHVHKPEGTVTSSVTMIPSARELVAFAPPMLILDGKTFLTKPSLTLLLDPMRTVPPTGRSNFPRPSAIPLPDSLPVTVMGGEKTYILSKGATELILDPNPTQRPAESQSNAHFPDPTPAPTLMQCTMKDSDERKVCNFNTCMQKFQSPIRYTSVRFAQWYDSDGRHGCGNVTSVTEVNSEHHWGITVQDSTYWQIHAQTTTDQHGWPTTIALNNNNPDDPLPCYDRSTCEAYCSADPKDSWSSAKPWVIALAVGLGLLFLIILAACIRRCRRRDGRDTRKGPLPAKRPTSNPNEIVQTAQSIPTTGTLGRRAEEGRGSLRFGNGAGTDLAGNGSRDAAALPAPGGEVGTDRLVVKPANTEYVEDVDNGGVTGSRGTGSDAAAIDTGSLRGRKSTYAP